MWRKIGEFVLGWALGRLAVWLKDYIAKRKKLQEIKAAEEANLADLLKAKTKKEREDAARNSLSDL